MATGGSVDPGESAGEVAGDGCDELPDQPGDRSLTPQPGRPVEVERDADADGTDPEQVRQSQQ